MTLGVVLVGTYGSVLNVAAVGVALSAVARDIGARKSAVDVDLVVSAILVGVVVALPVVGWASDRFGRRSTYLVSLLIFGVGAGLCAAAPSMALLIAARFVQGIGGGALIPVSMTIVLEAFPRHRRGMAMGSGASE